MKTLSAAMAGKLANTHGNESICIIEVQWAIDGQWHKYADKEIPEHNIKGIILSIGNMESVIKMDSQGQSQSIRMEVSDSDGTLKELINYNDPHGRPCRVYQWFSGIPISERFMLFEGEITSPVKWNEGSRSLGFEIVTKLADHEIGFSPEEGDFAYIPENLCGKAWPLAFGMVQNVPCTALQEVPVATTAESVNAADPSINDRLEQLTSAASSNYDSGASAFAAYAAALESLAEATGQRSVALYAANEQVHEVEEALEAVQEQRDVITNTKKWIIQAAGDEGAVATAQMRLLDEENTLKDLIDWYNIVNEEWDRRLQEYVYWDHLVDSRREAKVAAEYANTNSGSNMGRISNERGELLDLQADQVAAEVSTFKVIDGEFFPQDTRIELMIGAITFTGEFHGATFHIEQRTIPEFNSGMQEYFGFVYEQAGSHIRIKTQKTATFIANILPSEIFFIKAWKNVDGLFTLTTVPPDYYEVKEVDLVGYQVMAILLTQPLSFFDETWEDDIFATMESTEGPNTVDIMIWMIEKYTDLSYDETTFAYVRAMIDNYPSHFALLERKNIMQALEEMAFQARCAIWISGGTFYIKYLAEELTPDITVTEADIDVGSLVLKSTSAEELVTKFVARWTDDYAHEDKHTLVLRHNVKKFGTLERKFDFYIYNMAELVMKSATFWLIRKANIWKEVEFKTYPHLLALESFDTIEFSLGQNFIADSDVPALISDITYDSKSLELDVRVWVPVRFGEMEPYIFAWPSQIDPLNYFPTKAEVALGYAGGNGPGVRVQGGSTIVDETLLDWQTEQRATSSFGGGGGSGGGGGGGTSGGSSDSGRNPVGDDDHEAFSDTGRRFQDRGDTNPSDVDDVKPTPKYQAPEPFDDSEVDYNVYPQRGSYEPTPEEDYEPAEEEDIEYDDYEKMPYDPETTPESGAGSSTYPGTIVSGSGNEYVVNIHKKGLANETEEIIAKCVSIAENETIPPGTGVMVSRATWSEGATEGTAPTEENPEGTPGSPGGTMEEFTFQVAVWL
jgi:hypothetical protein